MNISKFCSFMKKKEFFALVQRVVQSLGQFIKHKPFFVEDFIISYIVCVLDILFSSNHNIHKSSCGLMKKVYLMCVHIYLALTHGLVCIFKPPPHISCFSLAFPILPPRSSRNSSQTARIWYASNPQQPPIYLTPSSKASRAYLCMSQRVYIRGSRAQSFISLKAWMEHFLEVIAPCRV